MSTFNYRKSVATVLALLKKFGSVGQIGDGATARGVLMVRLKTEDRPLLDSKINVGDFVYIVSPQVQATGVDSAPLEGERMLFNGEAMNIVNVHKLKPDNTLIYYQVWGRLG